MTIRKKTRGWGPWEFRETLLLVPEYKNSYKFNNKSTSVKIFSLNQEKSTLHMLGHDMSFKTSDLRKPINSGVEPPFSSKECLHACALYVTRQEPPAHAMFSIKPALIRKKKHKNKHILFQETIIWKSLSY